QWQVNMGGGFANVTTSAPYSGTTSPTLSILNVSGAYNGYIYRCVITGACTPPTITNSATLTVNTRPFLIAHPLHTGVCEGTPAVLSVNATGTGMSYQWQVNTGGGYVNVSNGGVISGATSAALTISNTAVSMHGNHYRCVLTGICSPAIITNEAVLRVHTAPNITSQPANKVSCAGNNTIFSVGATTLTNSGIGLTYQWQVNTSTGYTNLSNAAPYSGVTTANLLISNIPVGLNGNMYRCAVSTICTPVIMTNDAVLNVETLPTITSHPQDATICPGSNGSFIVGASGSGLLYQWQVNDGSGYIDIPGSSTAYNGMNNAVLNVLAVTPSMHGYQYRCRVRGNCSPAVMTTVARLSVHNPVIVNSHSNIDTVCEGKVSRLGVKATGGGLLYQWQRRQPDGTYADLMNIPPYSGVNTDSLRISGTPAGLNGSVYRCAITETVLCGLWYYTGDIPLTVNAAPASSPAQLEITQFGKGIFSVPAGASTYQWQENDNSGGGYYNLADGGSYKGVYTNTLTIDPVSLLMTGNMYRCIIDGICTSSITSHPSQLIINPSLGIGNKQLVAGGITIYPNPLSGSELSVRFDKVPVGSTEVKALDKLGKVVYTGTLEVNNSKVGVINLQALAAGVYMLQVMNADANIAETIQFTKQ
ncbi:MAG: T9SS type A sorting domain-containing protein, partial [Flavipsychrobacter sp.]|nr:T9SS type A sorting domain-containing protein [Flavipsychrobacter sp.]